MNLIQKAIRWGERKSPWIIHFNAGACNGCDIETIDALTPRFDLERLGILQQGSPRHADILICTGAVTLQTRERLRQIYAQMPEPKYVIAVGACACTGGVFDGCYSVCGGIDTTIPVDVYVPGCSVRPEALIAAIDKCLAKMAADDRAGGKAPGDGREPGAPDAGAAAADESASPAGGAGDHRTDGTAEKDAPRAEEGSHGEGK